MSVNSQSVKFLSVPAVTGGPTHWPLVFELVVSEPHVGVAAGRLAVHVDRIDLVHARKHAVAEYRQRKRGGRWGIVVKDNRVLEAIGRRRTRVVAHGGEVNGKTSAAG